MPPMCMYKSDNSGELKDFHFFTIFQEPTDVGFDYC